MRSSSGTTTLAAGRPDVSFYPASNLSQPGLTDADGEIETIVLRGIRYEICAVDPANGIQVCTYNIATNNTSSITLVTPTLQPDAPSGLSAPTPVSSASLDWNLVTGADSYNIYRDGSNIGSSITNSYTDTSATDGSHNYYVTAVNNSGESDPSNTVNVLVDESAPTITYDFNSLANTFDWHNSDVTISFDCMDALTLIISCTDDVTVSTEGADQDVIGNAEDEAGNTASDTVTLNIDKTDPIIAANVDQSPNINGWNNTDVTVSFDCNDALSGVQSCTLPITASTEGAGQSVSGTAVDYADNTAGIIAMLNIDKTAPSISYSISPAANSNGWHNGAVTITFSCDDTLSGVDTCTPPVTVSTEGENQVVTGAAVDMAGNSATTTASVSIDTTTPAITAVKYPAPNANGWNNTNVTVTYTCSDSLSGISSCSSPTTLSTEGNNLSAIGTAVDNAGNTNDVTVSPIKIDKTAPTISNPTMSNTLILFSSPETLCATVSDSLSGIVNGEFYIDTDPGQGNGAPMTYSNGKLNATTTIANLGFGILTPHTLYMRSHDAAGNWSAPVSVTFYYTGF